MTAEIKQQTAESKQETRTNPMRDIYIDKVVVNIGVGEGGEKLAKAQKVLELITKQKAVSTRAKKTNRDFGIRRGMNIGAKVTLRGTKAFEFLKTALWIKENKLSVYSIDDEGNFTFGIPDYTSFPGQKYDPEIGIFGMDVCVRLVRKGIRITRRVRNRKKIPRKNRVTYPEVVRFVRKNFNVEVIEV